MPRQKSISGHPEKLASGFGLSGLFLSVQILKDRVARNEITVRECAALIRDARTALGEALLHHGGDPDVMRISDQALLLAQQEIQAHPDQKPTEDLH